MLLTQVSERQHLIVCPLHTTKEAINCNYNNYISADEIVFCLFLQLILSAKVHVIRDAQILEKDLIRKEMDGENRRLDQMMEVERVNALRIEEEIERQRKEERMIGALKIMEQIEENEQVIAFLTFAFYCLNYHLN